MGSSIHLKKQMGFSTSQCVWFKSLARVACNLEGGKTSAYPADSQAPETERGKMIERRADPIRREHMHIDTYEFAMHVWTNIDHRIYTVKIKEFSYRIGTL